MLPISVYCTSHKHSMGCLRLMIRVSVCVIQLCLRYSPYYLFVIPIVCKPIGIALRPLVFIFDEHFKSCCLPAQASITGSCRARNFPDLDTAMPSIFLAASVFSFILFVVNRFLALRRNIRVAKQTNVFPQLWPCNLLWSFANYYIQLPYIIVPIYTAVTPWLVTRDIILPWLKKLPEKWTKPWLE